MKYIYATSGPHALIQNNVIPVIGTITEYGQNFDVSGKTQPLTKVSFDFDANRITDEFYFQDEKVFALSCIGLRITFAFLQAHI